MEPRPEDFPKKLRLQLLGSLDAALPDCWWKKRFVYLWRNHGLDGAWSQWKSTAPIVNETFIPLIESNIEELKAWAFS